MKFPKINFKLDKGESIQKPPKEKIFCYKCGIIVNTLRRRGIEYKDGFLCDSCASHHAKQIIEKRKEDDKEM